MLPMRDPPVRKEARQWMLSLFLGGAYVLTACSSSAPLGLDTSSPTEAPDSAASNSQAGVSQSLGQLQDDPALLSAIPDIVSSEIRADTGLQIAYTRADQIDVASGLLVETQWQHMQQCLGLVMVPPVVVIREGPVLPFTADDVVIRDIEGTPVASASHREVAIVQVTDADFDGTLGNPGFNLRSIMGRLLWLSADLAVRDYPYECARQQIVID